LTAENLPEKSEEDNEDSLQGDLESYYNQAGTFFPTFGDPVNEQETQEKKAG